MDRSHASSRGKWKRLKFSFGVIHYAKQTRACQMLSRHPRCILTLLWPNRALGLGVYLAVASQTLLRALRPPMVGMAILASGVPQGTLGDCFQNLLPLGPR